MHLVGEKMGDEDWKTISVGRETYLRLFKCVSVPGLPHHDDDYDDNQGGRTWQAFGGGKHGHETFRHARNYNFRDKCVVFARNLKFLNLTQ